MEFENEPNHEITAQIEPPPSYAIAREVDALASIQKLQNLIFVLDRDKIKVQNEDTDIYFLNLSPSDGKEKPLSFGLRTYQNKQTDPMGRKIVRSKEIYSVNQWTTRMSAPQYTISSEARSFYAYRPGCSVSKGDLNMLPFTMLLHNFGLRKYSGSWRLRCDNNKLEPESGILEVARREIGGKKCLEYEWVSSGEILALETVAATELDKPTFQIKYELQDRRLVHAMVLAWAVIIWHYAIEQRKKQKAAEISESLTCKSTSYLYYDSELKIIREAEVKYENSQTDGL